MHWITYGITFLLGIALVTSCIANKDPPALQADPPFKFIPREGWGAFGWPFLTRLLSIRPAPMVIIQHTASLFCNNTDLCKTYVQNIQKNHISRGWDDIGYNFLVGGDGAVYEGLGWDIQGAHTATFNNRSIGIGYIGNFMDVPPTRPMIRAGQLLLEKGLKMNKITSDYKLFAAKQLRPTESPGAAFITLLKEWLHWAEYDPSKDVKTKSPTKTEPTAQQIKF